MAVEGRDLSFVDVLERRRPGPRLEYFEYHHLISYYRSIFGPDRVLVLPFEALRRDRHAFVSEITKFVGLPAPTDVPSVVVNPSSPAAMLAAIRVVNVILDRKSVV